MARFDDDELNPAKDSFDNLLSRENKGTVDSSNTDSVDEARENEEAGISLYRPGTGGRKSRTKFSIKGLKKKGPIAGIIGLVFGAGIGFSALVSPSLLLVHMKEIMTEKFNTQLSSLEARSNRIMTAKMNDQTKGLCTSVVSIRCKFSTMSEKQVKNFREAGIEVEPNEPNALGKRTKPTAYIYKDQRIGAADFERLARTDPTFKSALRQAYNPHYTTGFGGKAWSKLSERLGINKRPSDLGGSTKEERMSKLNNVAKNAETSASAPRTASDFLDEDGGCPRDCAEQRAAEYEAERIRTGNEGTSGEAAKKVSGLLSRGPLQSVSNGVKVTGALDSYCQAYSAIRGIGYAAKTIRAIQLARYAAVFLKAADELKAGELKPETADFLGSTLTETRTETGSNNSKVKVGSATDSLGFKYAAFGDTTANATSADIANRYMAGGGFTGQMLDFSNIMLAALGGNTTTARQTCNVLGNPFVQAGSMAAGIALLFVPGVNVVKTIGQGAIAVAVDLGVQALPALLGDIVAGTVTNDISGEDSGNAIASGSGKLMSDTLAGLNGNAMMSKADALAYSEIQNKTLSDNIAFEQATMSPFDITSKNTFLGSIAFQLQSRVQLNNGASTLSSLGSFISSSFTGLTPKTSALTQTQQEASLNACKDEEAEEIGYSTDLFCNVVRGIPPQYLNIEPLAVATNLVDRGLVNDATGEPLGEYKDFVAKCIENEEAPGYETGDYNPEEAKKCIINDSNAYFYLYYMDRNVNADMTGETPEETAAANTSTDKKSLAQKIVAKNKVTYLGDVKPTLEDIANGTTSSDEMPCGININILRAIDAITDKHSIKISDINRGCTNNVLTSYGSRHNAGNGSAIDIAVIDGVATRGRDAVAQSVIGIIMPILSEAATSTGSYSQLGQTNCGSTPPLAEGVRNLADFCNHLHFDVPPKSDPTLKFDPVGW